MYVRMYVPACMHTHENTPHIRRHPLRQTDRRKFQTHMHVPTCRRDWRCVRACADVAHCTWVQRTSTEKAPIYPRSRCNRLIVNDVCTPLFNHNCTMNSSAGKFRAGQVAPRSTGFSSIMLVTSGGAASRMQRGRLSVFVKQV